MESVTRRSTHTKTWIVPAVVASTVVGLATPSVLLAQVAVVSNGKQAVAPAAAPATRAVAQPVPAAPNPSVPVPQVAVTPAPPPTAAAAQALLLGRAFTEVAEQTLPSVVSIRVESTADP